MEEILKIDTVDQYNKLFGFETRHPQVGVVSFDTAESQGNYRMTILFGIPQGDGGMPNQLRQDEL